MDRGAFKRAAEAGDWDAFTEALAPEVQFRGPAFGATRPTGSRDEVVGIFKIAFSNVYRDFRFIDSIEGPQRTVLLFTARVGEHELEGAQVLTFGADDRVTDLAVMARPAPAAAAIGEEILKHLDFDPRSPE
jgi:hypothetical protein